MTSDTTFSYWTPGVATKSYLKVYEHDNQGNRIERRAYYWSSNNTWEEVEKHEYTYDANGNRTASYRYDWDETLSEWFMYERVLITYQANNIPYQVRAFELNMDTGLWEPEFTFEYFASLHFIVQSPETPADGQPLFYPNPTNGLIQTKDNMLYDEVNVYDSMGKLLLQLKDVNEIDLRPFPAGMYFIDLQNDGKHVDGIQKMIKK